MAVRCIHALSCSSKRSSSYLGSADVPSMTTVSHNIRSTRSRSVLDSGGIGNSDDVATAKVRFADDERCRRGRWVTFRSSVQIATPIGDRNVIRPV